MAKEEKETKKVPNWVAPAAAVGGIVAALGIGLFLYGKKEDNIYTSSSKVVDKATSKVTSTEDLPKSIPVSTLPDGSSSATLPNGTTILTNPDGTTSAIVTNPDGTITTTTTMPNGNTITATTNPEATGMTTSTVEIPPSSSPAASNYGDIYTPTTLQYIRPPTVASPKGISYKISDFIKIKTGQIDELDVNNIGLKANDDSVILSANKVKGVGSIKIRILKAQEEQHYEMRSLLPGSPPVTQKTYDSLEHRDEEGFDEKGRKVYVDEKTLSSNQEYKIECKEQYNTARNSFAEYDRIGNVDIIITLIDVQNEPIYQDRAPPTNKFSKKVEYKGWTIEHVWPFGTNSVATYLTSPSKTTGFQTIVSKYEVGKDSTLNAALNANQKAAEEMINKMAVWATSEYLGYTYTIRTEAGKWFFTIYRADGSVLVADKEAANSTAASTDAKAMIASEVGPIKTEIQYKGYKFQLTYDPTLPIDVRYYVAPEDILIDSTVRTGDPNYWRLDATNFRGRTEENVTGAVKTAIDAKITAAEKSEAIKKATIDISNDEYKKFIAAYPSGVSPANQIYQPSGSSGPYTYNINVQKGSGAYPYIFTSDVYAPDGSKVGSVSGNSNTDRNHNLIDYINKHWTSIDQSAMNTAYQARRSQIDAANAEAQKLASYQYILDAINSQGMHMYTTKGTRRIPLVIKKEGNALTIYKRVCTKDNTTIETGWKTCAKCGGTDTKLVLIKSFSPPTLANVKAAIDWIDGTTISGYSGVQVGNKIVFNNGRVFKPKRAEPSENYYMDTGTNWVRQPSAEVVNYYMETGYQDGNRIIFKKRR